MLTAIIVGTVSGLLIALAQRAYSSSVPQASTETKPRELPFRTMGTVDDVGETWGHPRGAPPPLGPLTACPRCGERTRSCTSCHVGGTDEVLDSEHRTSSGGFDRHCGYLKFEGRCLTFTHGTSSQRLCSPERRARYGFLWFNVCQEPGIHVHQRCERCAWSGIARIEPPDNEMGPPR